MKITKENLLLPTYSNILINIDFIRGIQYNVILCNCVQNAIRFRGFFASNIVLSILDYIVELLSLYVLQAHVEIYMYIPIAISYLQ